VSTCRCRSARRSPDSPAATGQRQSLQSRGRQIAGAGIAGLRRGRAARVLRTGTRDRTARPRARAPTRQAALRTPPADQQLDRLCPRRYHCCSGPATPTSSRSGARCSQRAVRKPRRVTHAHAAVDGIGIATTARTRGPTTVPDARSDSRLPLVRTKLHVRAQVATFTASNWPADA